LPEANSDVLSDSEAIFNVAGMNGQYSKGSRYRLLVKECVSEECFQCLLDDIGSQGEADDADVADEER
jgi:hypothetical protein